MVPPQNGYIEQSGE